MKIFIIAGEASGDALGAPFLKELKQSHAEVEIAGIGGPLMRQHGLNSLFPMEELSVMGIIEILPQLPNILRRIQQTADKIIESQPDLVLTIDAPDFCKRVVKKARPDCSKTKFVHYVAPTVWAWRPGRAKTFANAFDALLCLFPFEPSYFEAEGMTAHFVGHPVLKSDLLKGDKQKFLDTYDLSPDQEILGVFLGSRKGELKRTGQIFLNAALKWQADKGGRILVLPVLPHLKEDVKQLMSSCGVSTGSMDPAYKAQDDVILIDQDKADAIATMDLALAKSGTTGLELSAAGVPHIIGYKANAVTAHLLRKMLRVNYAHLTNIMLDQPVIPEFLQENCTAENLYQGLNNIDAIAQKKASETIRDLLKSDISACQATFRLLSS